jgi:magnesium transporter
MIQQEKDSSANLWINIDGLNDVGSIEKITSAIPLHPLVVEDIVNTHQRPKNVAYEGYLHTTLRMLEIAASSKKIESEQLSIILGKNFVITFQERKGDCFNPLRERLRKGKGRARTCGVDYLYYAIIDSVVDHYFVVIEDIDDRTEHLEEQLLNHSQFSRLSAIHAARRDLLNLRRALWPLREVVQSLIRDDLPFITPSTQIFMRDVYDHVIEILEVVDLLRETSNSLVELSITYNSSKVNEVMKTLTVIATIFMPLTFIVGIYGMNFKHMPELSWTHGYEAIWGIMIVITVGMIVQFRRKGWI